MRLSGVASAFSDDIAIDLGTANTLVHVIGRGIIIDEPSVVALRTRGGSREVLAFGAAAKAMLGRTPESIETIRPLRDGVIADFDVAEELLRQFIKRAKSMLGFRRPRILLSVPAGASPVERRAVYETAVSAGARRVYLIEEPVAAALGAKLPIDDPMGSMVVDIGGGTTDVAVLSLGGVVQARSLRCAGNAMDEAIIRHVRREHQLLIGESNAEKIKIAAGTASAQPNGHDTEIHLKGRDLRRGRIADFVQRCGEELAPEVASDICERGVCLTGGGAMLDRLDKELENRTGIPFVVPEKPWECVVQGSATVLQELRAREHLLIRP